MDDLKVIAMPTARDSSTGSDSNEGGDTLSHTASHTPSITPSITPEADQTARRLTAHWRRWIWPLVGAVVLTPLVMMEWPQVQPLDRLDPLGWVGLGLLLGWALRSWMSWRRFRSQSAAAAFPAELVTQDISTLQQAFAVLTQQVNATIQTSETAVMDMGERLTRVHDQTGELHQRIVAAVARSEELSAHSLSQADQHAAAVNQLAQHQALFEQTRQSLLDRVRASAEQVRRLSPLAEMISDIARQTNLLAINAAIEAARAGPEGSGFKVVAAEVRRLSGQTAEAARQVTDGIGQAAQAISQEAGKLEENMGESAAAQMGQIAEHIQGMSRTLGEVVPYLSQLSQDMDGGVDRITSDIIDTLGDMQFQDINRQLLEQINNALGGLSTHFAQIYQLIDGRAPPPPVQLEELLQMWTKDYVMHAQRVAHVLAGQERRSPAGGGASGGGGGAQVIPLHEPRPVELAVANGPRIELF
ncbi:methyl-accepting chemotaxis protein [Roseateles depolymerans]|uniref:Putative methyl-accepting chemotaxis protein n=1 Tax=Roseateles depolymerans TaxID=76731 RepID=A0A0U3LKM0_9BURK|nr:methyl-accepting chemotaxis protein [Roseateles depolymerans]ALV06946.1 Putative methyl-accepting chemotaxis protein [Roseateles depolymerans]REG19926.1 methyl-accepting chemotaxis protein (MCP) signaling protein [Roseateles depolymerans]